MAYKGRPTIRGKIFGRKLATAREAAGLTIDQVAKATSVSAATVYRQESGHVGVKPAKVPALADLYGVTDESVRAQWAEWARRAKVKGPWAASGSIVGPSHRDYADAENMATELRTWQLGVIPGLLQTARYSEEVIRAAATVRPGQVPDADEVSALVELREIRKGILDRDGSPRIWAVIGESAILTPPSATDADAHKEQIQHLLKVSETQATVQVLPMSTGLHGCLSGTFSIITIDDLDLVFREGYGDGSFLDDEERVRSYQARYERLQSQAMSISDTQKYLNKVLSRM